MIREHNLSREETDEYLDIIIAESDRLVDLSANVLNLSKVENQTILTNTAEFNLSEQLRRVIVLLENRWEEKNLFINLNCSEVYINGNEEMLKQVWINLIDNAVKFSFPNTNIDIKMWYDSKKAYFSVGNYGNGIAKEELPHIFDRFYKTDSSRTNRSSGAGLGLSFVKKIMLLHQQSVWVDSHEAKEGSNIKYTTFTISLALS